MSSKNIFASNLWFLVVAIIFLIVGIRYFVGADTVGAVINFIVAALFLIGYGVQIKFNKSIKRR